jgi:hypothetical protein
VSSFGSEDVGELFYLVLMGEKGNIDTPVIGFWLAGRLGIAAPTM